MPATATITKYCAVGYGPTHADGTPSYVAATSGYPVGGIAQADAASGATIDIWGPGAIVNNPAWDFTGASYAAVITASGGIGVWTAAIANLNIVGWVIDAHTLVVMPQQPITLANAGTAIKVGTGGILTT